MQRDRSPTVTASEKAFFQTFGFVVMRQVFDAAALSHEFDRTMDEAFPCTVQANVGGDALRFRYVPLMGADTPLSLDLLQALAHPASQLLGSSVLPVRAKGVHYAGATNWHCDSTRDVSSIGLAAYLEPLGQDDGALQVIPGSHRSEFGRAVGELIARLSGQAQDASTMVLPSYVLATKPGDVIAFDEHLYHASFGGRNRRQWRVDYVVDPTDAEGERKVRAYFEGIYAPNWDGGYDVDRFPSYSGAWRASGHTWVLRLAQLGVYEAAAKHEDYTRSCRQ
jgi:hypothetical protein